MSDASSDRKPASHRALKQVLKDRRAPRGKPGSVRWLQQLLGRPLVLQERGQQLQLTLLERRRSAEQVQADSLARLREELRQRLLEHLNHAAAHAMRQLVFVHDVLGRQGWPGVQAMDSRVLARALVQAQMLAQRESSRRLVQFVDRLRMFQAAAEAREERIARGGAVVVERVGDSPVDESEVTVEEFEASQRTWNATRPSKL